MISQWSALVVYGIESEWESRILFINEKSDENTIQQKGKSSSSSSKIETIAARLRWR